MRRSILVCLAAALLFGAKAQAMAPGMADPKPGFVPSTDHQLALRFAEQTPAPYAMNYSDEVARSLGVAGGRVDFLDTGPSGNAFMPALKGGIDHGGAMLRLQWHPGE